MSCDINGPPYQEVPHDFLYKASHASRCFISLDLKSADFHVLRLAAPQLMKQSTWAAWVQESIPELVKRVPFLTEMKPMRVRVLGKALHKKNAALQSHCIRILVRLLLVMAKDHEKDFSVVERAFQFSCDELCIKLKGPTSVLAAVSLSKKIEKVLEQLRWQTVLPVRVEVFELSQAALNGNEGHVHAAGGDLTSLYAGHPSLRESVQFVDLPAVHDLAWAKPHSHNLLSAAGRCDGKYFRRRIYSRVKDGEDNFELSLKKLPLGLRPSVTLEVMDELQKRRDSVRKLSNTAPSFVPKNVSNAKHGRGKMQAKAKFSLDAAGFSPKSSTPSKELSAASSKFVPKNFSAR